MIQLVDVLYVISGLCLIMGAGGMAGAVENGSGYIASGLLLAAAAACYYLGEKEAGHIRRRRSGIKKRRMGQGKNRHY